MKSSHRFLARFIFVRRSDRLEIGWGGIIYSWLSDSYPVLFFDCKTISRKKTNKMTALWSSDINIKLTAVRKKHQKLRRQPSTECRCPQKSVIFNDAPKRWAPISNEQILKKWFKKTCAKKQRRPYRTQNLLNHLSSSLKPPIPPKINQPNSAPRHETTLWPCTQGCQQLTP